MAGECPSIFNTPPPPPSAPVCAPLPLIRHLGNGLAWLGPGRACAALQRASGVVTCSTGVHLSAIHPHRTLSAAWHVRCLVLSCVRGTTGTTLAGWTCRRCHPWPWIPCGQPQGSGRSTRTLDRCTCRAPAHARAGVATVYRLGLGPSGSCGCPRVLVDPVAHGGKVIGCEQRGLAIGWRDAVAHAVVQVENALVPCGSQPVPVGLE